MMLTLLAIVAAMIGVISLLLVVRYRPPKKDEAAILYAKFTSLAGIDPKTGESPIAYLLRVREEKSNVASEASDITEKYLDTRYGPPRAASLQGLKDSVSRFSASI